MTPRIIFSFLLLLSLYISNAQEHKTNRFQIGPSLQVSSFSYLFKDNFGISKFKGAFNFQGEISSSYQIKQGISIGGDISFGSTNFKQDSDFSGLSLLDNNDPFLFVESSSVRKQLALNLNLHVNYALSRKEKYSLLIGTGPTSLILLQQDYQVFGQIPGTDITDTDKHLYYSDVLFGAIIRVENRFEINQKLDFSLTPFASYFFNRVHRNSNNTAKPFHLGLNAVLLIEL